MSGWPARIEPKPPRTSAWSSASSTRITPAAPGPGPTGRSRVARRSRRPPAARRSAFRRRARPARASRSGRARGPARSRPPGRRRGPRAPTAASVYRRTTAARAPRACLSTFVSASCDEPVERDVDAGRQVARDRPRRRSARAARRRGPGRRARGSWATPGWGSERVRRRRAAQQAEHAAELGDRLLPGVLDGAQRLPRAVRIAVEQVLGGAGLDHHDADAVGDDVVQLAGDPGALGGDGVRGPRRPAPRPAGWRAGTAPRGCGRARRSPRPGRHDHQRHEGERDVLRRADARHPEEEDDERGAATSSPAAARSRSACRATE